MFVPTTFRDETKWRPRYLLAKSFTLRIECEAWIITRGTIIVLFACFSSVFCQETMRKPELKKRSPRFSELANAALNDGDRHRVQWNSKSLRLALKNYSEAQAYSRLANLPRREVESTQRLGDVHAILSEYETAIDYYNRARQIAHSLSDERLEADVIDQLANTHLETANSKNALPYCFEQQELSRRTKYLEGTIRALNCLGVANSISGDVQQAQHDLEQALALLKPNQNDGLLAQTLLNLGYLHGNVGNMQQSLDFFRRALKLWVAIADRRKQALSLTAIAGLHALEGEKQAAMDLHNEALNLFRTIGNRSGEAATLNGIGYLYDDLGQRERALKAYSLALQLYQSIGNRSYAAITMGYLGRVYFARGEKNMALDFYHQKLDTSQSMQDRRMEAYTLRDIGSVLSVSGNKKQALDYYRRARALSQAVLDRRGEAYILNSIGSIVENTGDVSQSLSYYRQALSLMRAVADRRGEVLTLYEIARAEKYLGNLAEARREIERSLELIDKLRTKVLSPSLRISYLETVYQHYEFYIDLLMNMHRQDSTRGYDVLALQANERARARTLLENLIEARTDIRQGVDLELLAEEVRLRQQLNQKAEQQTRLLSGKHTSEHAAAIKKEVENLLARYEEVEVQVRERSPRYAALIQPPEPRLADFQQQLDRETVLLEYSLGEERSYGWVVTFNSITSFELPGRSQIEDATRELYSLLASRSIRKKNESSGEQRSRAARSEAAYPIAASRLSAMLMAPVASLLRQKRLVIVADGLLQYIPFAALTEPVAPGSTFNSFEPLVVNHEVVFLPSMSILTMLRKGVRDLPDPKLLAVFADPVFERDDPRVRQAGVGRSSQPLSKRTHLNRAILDLTSDNEPIKFQRLPFTLQEAQALASIVPETKQAIGFDASLDGILNAELRQYRIIHFATHGMLNNSHPELSGIVLSLIDKSGRPQNGFLRLNEIYNLDLRAELIVLSACQTALGKAARGEGFIGLTRGFIHAGAARIVASLWRINDRSTAELMRYFYEGMFRQHMTPAAALRAAQIRMWQINRWRSPHHWAAFVLQGEWK